MVIAKARGTKRKCQNEDCGLPFYDLNREAFECPNCATSFDLEREAPAAAPLASAYRSRRKPPELIIVAPPAPPTATTQDGVGDDDLPVDAASPDQPLLDDDEVDEEIDDISPTRLDGGGED